MQHLQHPSSGLARGPFTRRALGRPARLLSLPQWMRETLQPIPGALIHRPNTPWDWHAVPFVAYIHEPQVQQVHMPVPDHLVWVRARERPLFDFQTTTCRLFFRTVSN